MFDNLVPVARRFDELEAQLKEAFEGTRGLSGQREVEKECGTHRGKNARDYITSPESTGRVGVIDAAGKAQVIGVDGDQKVDAVIYRA